MARLVCAKPSTRSEAMPAKSLPFKINLALIATTILVSVFFSILVYPLEMKRSKEQINLVHGLLATIFKQKNSDLANEIFANQQRAIEVSLAEIQTIVADIDTVCLYKPDGALSLCSSPTARGPLQPSVVTRLQQEPSFFQLTQSDGLHLARYAHRIEVIGEPVGYLVISYNLERILDQNRILLILFWLMFVVTLAVMGLFLNLFLYKSVINPVNRLNQALNRVKQGKLGETVILPWQDEIGEMGTTFNEMSLNLLQSKEEIEQHRNHMEQLVQERTAELLVAKDQAESAEDSLRHQRDLLNILMETIPNPLFHKDVAGRYTGCNRAFETFIGKPRQQIIGKTAFDLAPPAIAERYQQQDQELFNHPGTQSYEWKVIRADGDTRDVVFNKATITDTGGKVIGLVGIISDITDLVQNRRQAEIANQTKSKFLANMSHEIRTPMNGVIGMTTLLLDSELDSSQRAYVETIRSSGESLLKIINDILDLSKIEAGKLALEAIHFDLRPLIDRLIDIAKIRSAEKHLQFICAVAPEVPDALIGDPDRLWQILLNLVGNACKFTSHGEIFLEVTALEINESARLRFAVHDSGMGIPTDKHHLLFQSFSQIDASSTRQFGGTGLGLNISKQLCELMNGEIGVQSEPDIGSEFWFTIQLPISPTSIAAPSWLALVNSIPILVVAENSRIRTMLARQLTAWGAVVTAVDSAKAAQELHRPGDMPPPFPIVYLSCDKVKEAWAALTAQVGLTSAATRLVLIRPMTASKDPDPPAAVVLTQPIRFGDLQQSLAQLFMGPAASSAQTTAQSAPPAKTELPKRWAILLAEDNPINQLVMVGILQKLGYNLIDIANNGAEAIVALEQHRYDLVLMDLSMPEIDGLEATRHIRRGSLVQTNRKVPIVALTAHAMRGDRERCLAAGMDDYITKPIDHLELARILARFLPSGASEKIVTEPTRLPQTQPARAAEMPPAIASVDFQALVDRLSGDQDMATTILAELHQDLPAQLAILQDCLAKTDCIATGRQAHKLKGALSNIGAESLCNLLARMEQLAKAGDPVALTALTGELMAEYRQVIRAIEGIRSALNPIPDS